MSLVSCILIGTAKAQTEAVSELSELSDELKKQNFCSSRQLGR